MAEWWSGSDLVLYIDKEDFKNYFGKEHGYLLMNHSYEIDWLIGWILCERVSVLGVIDNISLPIILKLLFVVFSDLNSIEIYVILKLL